jgi:hypothetical protein
MSIHSRNVRKRKRRRDLDEWRRNAPQRQVEAEARAQREREIAQRQAEAEAREREVACVRAAADALSRYILFRIRMTNEEIPKFFAEEYQRIQKDPRVTLLTVSERCSLSFRATITRNYEGQTYLLGVYDIMIDNLMLIYRKKLDSAGQSGEERLQSWHRIKLVHSGRKNGSPPPYATTSSFCLGSRALYVDRLLLAGEIPQFIYTMLDSLGHFNHAETQDKTLETEYKKIPEDLPSIVEALVMSSK